MLNQNPLRAALWMSCAVLAFSFMAVAARELLRHMGAFEILFLRTLVTTLLVGAAVARAGTATLRTRLFRFHLARALMHLGGQYCWIYAIGALTLATVFAIEFTMPVWVALLATAFLGERMNRGRVVMLVLGLAGIAIIVRPDLGGLHPAALVMVLGSMFYAGNMVMTKRISTTDSPLAVLFWMSLTQLPLTFATAAPQWVTPGPVDVFWAAVIGSGSFVAHYSMTRAMKLGDATLVVPIDFLRLPLIAVVGAVFYGEPLQAATFVGAAVIFAGTYYSLSREARRA
ncbi:MAG TPA: DMT family transporter [Burkholderiales bacterium]|jgi:drug/metabolite transporter (DMT)-like permease|nr:DMT family transporter [Burkholderiales bacterium]